MQTESNNLPNLILFLPWLDLEPKLVTLRGGGNDSALLMLIGCT